MDPGDLDHQLLVALLGRRWGLVKMLVVRRRGDRAAVLGEHPADRLDTPSQATAVAVALMIAAARPADRGGRWRSAGKKPAGVDLGLAEPLAHRFLAADPEQLRHLVHRRPLRLMLIAYLRDHPHRPLFQLRRVPP